MTSNPTPSSGAELALIERFYAAFGRRDGAAMAACYHPEIEFRDPVFHLRGARAGLMWRMLTAAGKDLVVTASDLRFDGERGHARWEARYTFSATGRPVHNVVQATFEFRDGLIVRHTDDFSFWRWARQALGVPGVLLGWSPWLQNKVSAQAARGLEAYVKRQGG
jgi:ketosteroid isomerase-like protein